MRRAVEKNIEDPLAEDDPLGGHDVYSMSKAATELVVAAWHASFFSREPGRGRLASVRAGNVIGGGDNPTGIDPDFNHDGNGDQADIDSLVNVIAGGACP